ncbi:sensor histidine kinase [Elioraea thermophila]|uniref:sensor histidine kinase n=1 Tax=Elioraea thermophila TaxID=2185104 RepID=UPI000DF2FC2F|nr:HAMP domain-containing sensor histidine kinase [Elioraea thermophila]
MADRRVSSPRPARSLSSRLLWLTVGVVLVAQVLILGPSLGRAHLDWLANRIAASHLAALALEAAPDQTVDEALEEDLLRLAGVEVVSLRRHDQRVLALARPLDGPVSEMIDLGTTGVLRAAVSAFAVLVSREDRLIRVIGPSPKQPDVRVDIVLRADPLQHDLERAFATLLVEALAISASAGALMFLVLNWLLVRPMRRLTRAIVAFRLDPEGAPPPSPPRGGNDEIGVAMRELAAMQDELRRALWQKSRLAALGAAVTRINHDLRGILATALLVSDRLTGSADPKVREVAPTLLAAIERAVALCRQTLAYAREGPPLLDRRPTRLVSVVAEAGATATPGEAWRIDNRLPPTLEVQGDRDQLFRVFLNLFRNAFEAGAQRVRIEARETAETLDVLVSDNGPGLPERVRANLFSPFVSGKQGGSGLGLAIARDIMRAHGGDIALERTGPEGTVFVLSFPREPAEEEEASLAVARRQA